MNVNHTQHSNKHRTKRGIVCACVCVCVFAFSTSDCNLYMLSGLSLSSSSQRCSSADESLRCTHELMRMIEPVVESEALLRPLPITATLLPLPFTPLAALRPLAELAAAFVLSATVMLFMTRKRVAVAVDVVEAADAETMPLEEALT